MPTPIQSWPVEDLCKHLDLSGAAVHASVRRPPRSHAALNQIWQARQPSYRRLYNHRQHPCQVDKGRSRSAARASRSTGCTGNTPDMLYLMSRETKDRQARNSSIKPIPNTNSIETSILWPRPSLKRMAFTCRLKYAFSTDPYRFLLHRSDPHNKEFSPLSCPETSWPWANESE